MSNNKRKFLIDMHASVTALKRRYRIKEAYGMDERMVDAVMDCVKEHMSSVPCDGCDASSDGVHYSGELLVGYFCNKCWEKKT